jgi:hypothetical protein
MKRKYPLTYQYLRRFEQPLRTRSGYRKYFDPSEDPFWTIYNVGEYTLAPFRVAFKELTDFFQCAVIPASKKPIIPDTKLRFIDCQSEQEAYFLCGLLNSSPAQLYLFSTATWVQTADYQASDISRIAIPAFQDSVEQHKRIAALAEQCHTAAGSPGQAVISKLEAELDDQVAKVWRITAPEMRGIRNAINEQKMRRRIEVEAQAPEKEGE